MKLLKLRIIHIMLLSASLFSFPSCEKTSVDLVESADQLFRPVRFEAEVEGQTVNLSWIPIRHATYIVELMNDNDIQLFTLSNVKQLIIEDLKPETQYTARIKAVSIDKNIKDSEFQEITFITGIKNDN